MARVVVVQVGEQARLGGREVLAYLVEAGVSGVGEEDLACAAVAGVGSAGDRFVGAWSPDVFAEDDSFIPEPLAGFRKAAEDTVLAAADDGVRAMVIRPGQIWGPGDHGHMSMIYQSVAATGAAVYIGQGLNTYSHVRKAGGGGGAAAAAPPFFDAPFFSTLPRHGLPRHTPDHRYSFDRGTSPMCTADWLPDGFTIHRIATNNTHLSVAVGGRGPVLVLLHGWPQRWSPWPGPPPTPTTSPI
ncbi:hypothetical protein ACFW95_17675 [Streptomyces sp. NPDC059474]|uniref:hypothetical protein n=1 Tax=Streptomyces sp. NPDC059474 TaxID=3346846 RepID=UPI0036876102